MAVTHAWVLMVLGRQTIIDKIGVQVALDSDKVKI